jgi:hypothetical protein
MSKKKFPKPTEGKCYKCGIEVTIDIPFIDGHMVGRKSKDHGCGKEYIQYLFKFDRNDPDLEGLFE